MSVPSRRRPSAATILRDWRTKAALQRVLSSVPGGARLNYLLQRHVTHGVPISDGRLRAAVGSARAHLDAFSGHAVPMTPAGEATFFEFGAGWDLHVAITLYALGVGSQVVVDRTPHARPDLVDDVAARLARDEALDEAAHARLRSGAGGASTRRTARQKASAFGITYLAPADARATELASGCVDCVTSTSTLEHIPRADIGPILRECRRILRPGGVASFVIDYSDHYSHFDRSITPFNFLRYSERRWRRYNSSIQFQNRMRHSEYVDMFRATGFEIVHDSALVDEGRLAELRSVPLAAEFTRFELADVARTGAHVVLRAPV
ncbi:MAG: class I SAM-dependent methyltransferase [Acidimicrobiia bacterium]